YNMGPGGLMYAPTRDIAYNYPTLIEAVRNAINEDYWPEYVALMEKLGGTFDDLDKANIACAEYLNRCCDDPDAAPAKLMEEVGWDSVPLPARFAWLAMIGQVMMVQLFHAVRSSTPMNTQRQDVVDVVAACREARRIINGTTETDELYGDLKEVIRRLKKLGESEEKIEDVIDEAL